MSGISNPADVLRTRVIEPAIAGLQLYAKLLQPGTPPVQRAEFRRHLREVYIGMEAAILELQSNLPRSKKQRELLALLPDGIAAFGGVIESREYGEVQACLSKWLAIAIRSGATNGAYADLEQQRYLDDAAFEVNEAAILQQKLEGDSGRAGGGAATSAPRKRKRPRRRRTAAVRKLTDLQLQAVELYAKHEGRLAPVAREMGITHTTARQHLEAARRKGVELLRRSTAGTGRTRRLPTDHRGQIDVGDDAEE